MSKVKLTDQIAGEVLKRPFREVRIWFHDIENMTFKGITITPEQLPYKIKDSNDVEYNLSMEHLSKLFYYDWKLKRMKFNLGYLARIFMPRKTAIAIMEYGTSTPITHLNQIPEFSKLRPQGLLIDVKQTTYSGFLKSLIGRGLMSRKLIIAMVVIIIMIVVVYFLMQSGMIRL
jgi:hypothetical protein